MPRKQVSFPCSPKSAERSCQTRPTDAAEVYTIHSADVSAKIGLPVSETFHGIHPEWTELTHQHNELKPHVLTQRPKLVPRERVRVSLYYQGTNLDGTIYQVHTGVLGRY